MIESIVVCHFDEDGNESYHVFGDERVRLFIVDDRAPDDRVYEWTSRAPTEELSKFVPKGVVIGHQGDERHAAIKARIEARQDGRPHLTSVAAPSPPALR